MTHLKTEISWGVVSPFISENLAGSGGLSGALRNRVAQFGHTKFFSYTSGIRSNVRDLDTGEQGKVDLAGLFLTSLESVPPAGKLVFQDLLAAPSDILLVPPGLTREIGNDGSVYFSLPESVITYDGISACLRLCISHQIVAFFISRNLALSDASSDDVWPLVTWAALSAYDRQGLVSIELKADPST